MWSVESLDEDERRQLSLSVPWAVLSLCCGSTCCRSAPRQHTHTHTYTFASKTSQTYNYSLMTKHHQKPFYRKFCWSTSVGKAWHFLNHQARWIHLHSEWIHEWFSSLCHVKNWADLFSKTWLESVSSPKQIFYNHANCLFVQVFIILPPPECNGGE